MSSTDAVSLHLKDGRMMGSSEQLEANIVELSKCLELIRKELALRDMEKRTTGKLDWNTTSLSPGKPKKVKKPIQKKSTAETAVTNTTDKNSGSGKTLTIKSMQAVLDQHNVTYSKKLHKAELLALIKANYLVRKTEAYQQNH
jgi:hypothetical protein